jgi:hypothetical protein
VKKPVHAGLVKGRFFRITIANLRMPDDKVASLRAEGEATPESPARRLLCLMIQTAPYASQGCFASLAMRVFRPVNPPYDLTAPQSHPPHSEVLSPYAAAAPQQTRRSPLR